jgi:hypothetical protein
MGINDPLARLLRFRGMLAEGLPDGELNNADAEGLASAYLRARTLAADIAKELGIRMLEFDNQFPQTAGEVTKGHMNPQMAIHNLSIAKTAALLLGQLGGWAGGLIEQIALEQGITSEQAAAAREAARPPIGFR